MNLCDGNGEFATKFRLGFIFGAILFNFPHEFVNICVLKTYWLHS